jgi:hypothetical protein
MNVTVRRLQRRCDIVDAILVARADDDVRSVGDESLRDRSTNVARSAGHDRRPIGNAEL